VGEGHVADSQAVKYAENAEAVGDEMAAFQTGHGGEFTGLVNALYVCGGVGELHVLFVRGYFGVEGIESFESSRKPPFRREVLGLGVEPKEDRAELAFAHPRNIELVVFVFVAEPIALVDEVARGVDVRIEDEDVAQEAGETVLCRELGSGERKEHDQTVHARYYTGGG
jgi:hypothetical protein